MSNEMASGTLSSEYQTLMKSTTEGKRNMFIKAYPPVTLKFEDVIYETKTSKRGGLFCKKENSCNEDGKLILKGVSGSVFPGELLAILGPSGSGKTTLINALGGRLKNGITKGSITYNGKKLLKSMKRNLGFVHQHDLFYSHLTVHETLVFSALLRLPNSLSKQEKIAHACAVMDELDLNHCKDTIMGGPLLRGVSGGERKRVSIGQELLTNPSLLLVDEPTSGLDSTTARRIVLTLCDLAKSGRTVVMTIHQPSSKLFYMFPKILLLSDGSTLYFGKGELVMNYFYSIGYAPSVAMNPTDFLLDLASGIYAGNLEDEVEATKQVLKSAFESNLASQVNMELKSSKVPFHNTSGDEMLGQYCTTWWQQFTILINRGFKERKYDQFSILIICKVLAASTISGLVWWQAGANQTKDLVGLLFYYTQVSAYLPMLVSIYTFPYDHEMLMKEKSCYMYRLSTYVMANSVVELPAVLAMPTIFVTITYWMVGLKPNPLNFFQTLAIVLLYALVSQGIGLAIGAVVVSNQKLASRVGSVVMTLYILSNGFYVQHVPSFVSWIKHISHSYYGYKLLLGSQFKDNVTCSVREYQVIQHVGLDHQIFSVFALVAMVLVYRIIAYFALMIVVKHS
ncbi:hypothetical protein HN51_013194 [Arachis hypogaea]|uniref:ABC transporter G family member 9-like n=2 Tax=Arachis TaxID=3817 RepID=A0A6P4CT61_ARADU|nr:ABC transporter G family member 9-like [Arachis duranensis]XP_015956315.1 ABC transporter G family member 9-like [Arachis duranensis]XP_025690048.1 ABC transporter G family member 9 [Arachis hypogaea]XP_025690049.1 ABC transporter G family member 9 [Arachis hypogaea]QHO58867.1 ABC transporter G family member [Arachis hypogaea]